MKEEKKEFYYFENGLYKIVHSELINFLGENGFANMRIGGTTKLVRIQNNIVSEVNESDLSWFIKDYLISLDEKDVLEAFVKGIGSYLNKRKYELLPKVQGLIDKDPIDCAWLYFKNVAVKVTENKIVLVSYPDLPHKIWKNRIIDKDFNLIDFTNGQFKDFCFKLSKKDVTRFNVLKTLLGYLLHRHNNPAVVKIAIFMDENATKGGQTNGGTGKSLLAKALSHCVETVLMDGKNMKRESRFNNQRINHTTDIVCFDDVDSKFSLEIVYSMATSGFVIEKKGKDELILKPEESPKILISTNYFVNGSGGSSDARRRHEFEVANYFSDKLTPKMVYKNLFFDEWDDNEWNCFFSFMIDCIQLFLKAGLLEPMPLNIKVNKLTHLTSPEFLEFTSSNSIPSEKWIEKAELLTEFKKSYPTLRDITSHKLTKWLKLYASEFGLEYIDKKTGKKYEFKLKARNELNNETGDENNI
ncbi:primase-helicase family protein [Flavobacterium sp. FlaQc-28]|uniref:primase-helicase family protein n=1 Tax=Flavobacterium sp. FlaQc-28 TaxID=3374178 RepID=UPI0037564F0D